MMRLNGDLTTSFERFPSQISIYNYPDHLNPFNDEDNHKRLRFWNFSKRNDNSRRRSFSIGQLRDVWNLKSFSLKKKSSTLGINKTSESPPVLRRNLDSTSIHKSFVYPGDMTAVNRGQLTSSLQEINTPTCTGSKKVNGKLIQGYQDTFQFDRRLNQEIQQFHPNRSSYSSLSSTNPFESDIESDVGDMGNITVGTIRKSNRKKRKAPLAPNKNMDIKASSNTEISSDTIQGSTIDAEQNIDIKSLTVEIEKFVNSINETSLGSLTESDTQPTKTPIDVNLQSCGESTNISDQKYFIDVRRHDEKSNVTDETTVRKVEDVRAYEKVTENAKVVKLNSKLLQSKDCDNQKMVIAVEKTCLNQNKNNVDSLECLNKPLTIFENSEKKIHHSQEISQSLRIKSVKEIIDSINRSQQLLKDSAAKGTKVYSTSLYVENNIGPKSGETINRHEMFPNVSTDNTSVANNLLLQQNYFQKSKINKKVFQYRESSPTASNLDWNPLPKPKRTNNGSTI